MRVCFATQRASVRSTTNHATHNTISYPQGKTGSHTKNELPKYQGAWYLWLAMPVARHGLLLSVFLSL